jgi:hypothetical protein
MPIYTDLRVRDSLLEEYPAPLSDVLSEQFSPSENSPIEAIMRRRELARAYRGAEPDILDFNLFGPQAPSTASPMLDAGTARQRIKDEGLDISVPDEGIRQRALDILIERKQDERRREDILARGPQGFVPGTLGVGASLAGSALDPLNVASAFIPVIPEARYAALLARASGPFGRAGVRAGVGALEGAAGAAALEPIIYSAKSLEQADYDLADSLRNIAFGTVLGGGLHVGAGAISDAISRGLDWRSARGVDPLPRAVDSLDFSTRDAALRASVGQVMDGRSVDIEPVMRAADEWDPNILFRGRAAPPAEGFDLGPLFAGRYERYSEVSPGDQNYLTGLVDELNATEPGQRVFLERDFQGSTPDVVGIPATTPDWFQAINREATESNQTRSRLLNRTRPSGALVPDYRPILTRADVQRVVGKVLNREPLGKREGELAQVLFSVARERREATVGDALRARTERTVARNADLDRFVAREHEGLSPAEIAELTRRELRPDRSRLADAAASAAAEERLAAARKVDEAEALLGDAVEEVGALGRALGLQGVVGNVLKAADNAAETLTAYANAVRAAAQCQLRRGA